MQAVVVVVDMVLLVVMEVVEDMEVGAEVAIVL